MSEHWLSSKKMTILVTVENGRIVVTPPIARKFIGQPIENLIEWMRRQGGLVVETYPR